MLCKNGPAGVWSLDLLKKFHAALPNCLVGCGMTKLGVLKNNEIDLESVENIIKIRGIAGGEDIIKNLQVCVEKVGVQTDECLFAKLVCPCLFEAPHSELEEVHPYCDMKNEQGNCLSKALLTHSSCHNMGGPPPIQSEAPAG
uniref:Uncharacterized protein n=1 Tax=Timema poppense TaxID=170557 RepID=A0A7R9HCE0_TIMPO|nr:unnamed protein product [Timema poppensis]